MLSSFGIKYFHYSTGFTYNSILQLEYIENHERRHCQWSGMTSLLTSLSYDIIDTNQFLKILLKISIGNKAERDCHGSEIKDEAHTHTHTHAPTHSHTYIGLVLHTHTHTHTHTRTHTHVYIYIYIYIH